MSHIQRQDQGLGLIWRPLKRRFRLRVGDVIRMDDRLCRVIRVTECAAVLIMNPPVRAFTTRFDRQVRFRPSPVTFRISPNSEVEILNRRPGAPKKRRQH